jgi:multidrug resistance efflux pump
MSIPFSRSMQSLAADGFCYSLLGMLLAAALLSAWTVWLFIARVRLYEVSTGARLEVSEAAYPVEAQVAGRVGATHLILGQEVQGGDVLVELDVGTQRLQLEEERARLAALASQPAELRSEIKAEEAAKHEDQQAGRIALAQARTRYREAEATAQLRVQEAKRIGFLYARAAAAELEFLRATAEVRKNEETINALRLEVGRLERDLQMRVNDRQTRLQRLKLYVTQLEGQIAVTRATSERLEYEIERRYIRAPVAGRLGEVATLQVGTWVREGARLGAVVPPGTLKVMADFLPSAAIGRIQAGQPARLRLEGFPWTQYGAISATVASVASEVRDGRVRVELALRPNLASPIPLQHGLPGTVEVEVDRVSPAILVLRTAGQLLAVSGTSRDFQEGRGADRVPGDWRDFQEGRGADRVPGNWRNFQEGRGADRVPGTWRDFQEGRGADR